MFDFADHSSLDDIRSKRLDKKTLEDILLHPDHYLGLGLDKIGKMFNATNQTT